MADPREVWRASDGTSRQKSIRMVWPELASALDGEVAEAPAEVPPCAVCGKRPGRILVAMPAGDVGVCGLDVGLSRFHDYPKRHRP